jgi:hypothetical protein
MVSRILQWIRCRLSLCEMAAWYDDGGTYRQCGKCGKVNR